jgi:small conductance mechanosensitive channel
MEPLKREWQVGARSRHCLTRATLLALLLGGQISGSLGAWAAAPTHAPVMVGTRRLFDVGALPDQTAADRTAAINRRIDSFFRNPQQIAPVEVKLRGKERILAIGGRDLLTVTAQDADDNLTTVSELAQSWKQELDEALGALRAEHQTLWNQVSLSIVHSTENLIKQTAALIPRLVSTLLVFLIAFFAARGARAAVGPVLRRAAIDVNTQQLVRTLAYYGVWVVGWIVALGTLGINPATLVAGLGVTTIAIGFALKDLLSNFVSGFLILTTRPFTLGDQIAVQQFEGTVERIELRATHLRTYDNRLVIIPNADLYTATITNNTASPYRRQEFIVGIGYEADLNRACELARHAALNTEGVLADPAPDAVIDDLANGSINLKVRFHTDSRRGKAMPVISEVRRRVKEAFQHAGIELYPTGPPTVRLQGPLPPVSGLQDRDGNGSPPAAPARPADQTAK